MDILARREHSEFELSQKLRKKGLDENDIQGVIAALRLEGLQSDARFTECYILHRRNKGYGPIRIHAELLSRGIPEDLIEHHLNIADNAWFAAARKTWLKRFKKPLIKDFKERAKQMRFLQYRGYTSEHINSLYQTDYECED